MRPRSVWAALALAVWAALAPSWPVARPALVVRHEGRPVLVLPVEPGERVGLRFIHSVDGLPVEDWYEVRPDGLMEVESRLLSFGTGMGQIPGQGHAVEDGPWLRVTGLERPIGVLRLRVGPSEVDHTLLYRGGEIPLSARWAGEALTLEAGRAPLWAARGYGWGDRR
ncbi:DUF1850 domain-containing protein [Limnochorda pilosa]|uniref:DUF1850 domain-containing protein n=1 Tax=Limnochorda pilosa TaxID=1555112 RepID=A0A0K2SFK9_LIMPI|nr:DUF1850 domain-containing protein [Limnochorda pilosa]BAS25888.1 hypothetical protein LIP_0029 [Limnochorda pilosa]